MTHSQKVTTGIIGHRIGYTLSPALHEQAAARLGFDLSYRIIDGNEAGFGSAEVPQLVARLAAEGYAGLNVTYPFKADVLSALDHLDELSATLGAVNTIVCHPDHTISGHNTDATGFGRGLDESVPDADYANVLQTGAGGAGAATAYAVLSRGAQRLAIADPHDVRRSRLVSRLREWFPAAEIVGIEPAGLSAATEAATGILNASPVGSVNLPGSPVPVERLHGGQWVADVVYAPLATTLLAAAERVGARCVDGGRMLVHQAAESFALFHGQRPDLPAMREHFLDLTRESVAC